MSRGHDSPLNITRAAQLNFVGYTDLCVLSAPIARQCLPADSWWPSLPGYRPADMEWPRGRRDISRIIDHISSPPQDAPVQEDFSWLLVGHQL